MLCLYIQAPFAVFRTFTAGSLRPTAPFITPSAAYGLAMNLAGIEMRCDDDKAPMTLIRPGLPRVDIAVGALRQPEQQVLFQQLHNYRVGETEKIPDKANPSNKVTVKEEGMRRCKATKYNITPARRTVLSDLRAYVAIRGNDVLERQIRAGLAGDGPPRYGLPFLGDNNFLADRIEEVTSTEPANWYVPLQADDDSGLSTSVARLTITIDRKDMARTRSALFRPIPKASAEIPAEAWVAVDYG